MMYEPDFGWSYPAGCSGTPYDDQPPTFCLMCKKDEGEWDKDVYWKFHGEMQAEGKDPGDPADPFGSFCSRECYEKWKVSDIRSFLDLANEFDIWPYSSVDGVLTKHDLPPSEWEDRCSRRVYKETSCGAWLRFIHDPDGVKVGSIVEGAEQSATPIDIYFPFKMDELWSALTNIEEQCQDIWDETHGCEQCWEDGWDGAINPDCPACHGEGTII